MHPHEEHLALVTLTPRAAERLGIETAKVERRPVRQQRTFAGEIVVPIGKSVAVSAPFPGTLEQSGDADLPAPGSRVTAGQPIFSFVPLLLPERYVPTPAESAQMADARASLAQAQTTAAGDVNRAEAEVAGAQIALNRAERLLEDRAGSARAVDEARAAHQIATETLNAARIRQQTLDRLSLDIEGGTARPVPLTAPQTGLLQNINVSLGQTVTAGTVLFEVVDLDRVWIRVPVYVGLLNELDTSAEAAIGSLAGEPWSSPRTAAPIAAPPSADAQSSSADLFYQLDNPDRALRPGQRVGVTIPLTGDEARLTIPFAAVLYDMHGAAWVYELVEEHTFQRRRVLLAWTDDKMAVLERGPEPGTEVVIAGAAELFGTEFGHGSSGGH